MSKTAVLITSLLCLGGVFASRLLGGFATWPGTILNFITIVLWAAVVYAVYADAKQRGKSPGFAGLTLLTGGFGGLIYYFVIFKEQ